MITRKMEFYSNCYRLAAALYLPDDYEEGQKLPCIIPNSGYMGLNEIYPALFARALTKRGFACFGFDYRGFLDNGGPAGAYSCAGVPLFRRNGYRQSGGRKPLFRNRDTALN